MELYKKVMKGKAVRYELITPEPERVLVNSEFTPEQIVTMVGTMGICLIESISRLLPEHTKVSREVVKANTALLTLFSNTGHGIDKETTEYACECWNETMQRISLGIPAPAAIGGEA